MRSLTHFTPPLQLFAILLVVLCESDAKNTIFNLFSGSKRNHDGTARPEGGVLIDDGDVDSIVYEDGDYDVRFRSGETDGALGTDGSTHFGQHFRAFAKGGNEGNDGAGGFYAGPHYGNEGEDGGVSVIGGEDDKDAGIDDGVLYDEVHFKTGGRIAHGEGREGVWGYYKANAKL